jgi:hypothetical protein
VDAIACAVSGNADLPGGSPVRLAAEGTDFVAYGLGGQRIVIPACEIGAVRVSAAYRAGGRRSGPCIAVLDRAGLLMLRAGGVWDERVVRGRKADDRGQVTDTGLSAVCESLDIAYPEYLLGAAARREGARWRRAPGYRRLRTRWLGLRMALLGLRMALLLWLLLALGLCGLCIALGLSIAAALPPGFGYVTSLIALVLVVASVWATAWFIGLARRLHNWAGKSLTRRAFAPRDQFLSRDPKQREMARGWLTLLMLLAVPSLIAWGPVVGLISLAHGFSDQALVTVLRQHGVTAAGTITSDTEYSTDPDGTIVVDTTIRLEFRSADGTSVSTPDPRINGWTWPVNQPSVEVVYDPARPSTAAVAGQLPGSVWRGAPTGNLICGALLTIALVPLTRATIRRIRAGLSQEPPPLSPWHLLTADPHRGGRAEVLK